MLWKGLILPGFSGRFSSPPHCLLLLAGFPLSCVCVGLSIHVPKMLPPPSTPSESPSHSV
uniref:Uncharacterized protein n=1 Tax=Anguilla anguilla TaxID=7936 RepID=A0A0E9Q9W4_ANGAN